MKARLEDLKNGDLILYVSKSTATKAERSHQFPNPVLNVFDKLADLPECYKPSLECHFKGLALSSDKVLLNGQPRARVFPSTGPGTVDYSQLVELIVGQERIIRYLFEERPDLVNHRKWVSELKAPYKKSFKPGTKITII